jgi:SOS-response transcriptional repressor LexA
MKLKCQFCSKSIEITRISEFQKDLYKDIDKFFKKFGYSPSLQELGDKYEMTHTNILYHIEALIKAGYVERVPHKKKGYLPRVEV